MKKMPEKDQKFTFSKEGTALIKKEIIRYETKLSCLIPCLYQIQKEKGQEHSSENIKLNYTEKVELIVYSVPRGEKL